MHLQCKWPGPQVPSMLLLGWPWAGTDPPSMYIFWLQSALHASVLFQAMFCKLVSMDGVAATWRIVAARFCIRRWHVTRLSHSSWTTLHAMIFQCTRTHSAMAHVVFPCCKQTDESLWCTRYQHHQERASSAPGLCWCLHVKPPRRIRQKCSMQLSKLLLEKR